MSSKPWSRTKRVTFDVYGCHVDVVVCDSIENSWRDVKKHYECDYCDGIAEFKGLASQGRKGAFILFELESSNEIVAHECFHSCSSMLDYRGITLISNNANEAYAYAMGYLTGQALDFQAKCRLEHKKPKAKK